MDCVFIFAVVPLAAWADFATIRALARSGAGAHWWAALAVLFSLGLAAGIWCGFHCEYRFSDTLRVFGFPVPAALFRLEDGEWVDYVTPFPALVASFDAAGITLVSLLPLSAASFLRRAVSRGDRPR